MRNYSAKTTDDYLSKLSPAKRAALSKVRKAVREASPRAVELISWGVPMFKYEGKYLVALVAFTNYCGLLSPWASVSLLKRRGINLSKYDTTKRMIRFAPEKSLPATLVKRIVRVRMKEIDAGR